MSVSIKNTQPIPVKDTSAEDKLDTINNTLTDGITVSFTGEGSLAQDSSIATTNTKLDTINTSITTATISTSVILTPQQSAVLSQKSSPISAGWVTGAVQSILYGNLISLFGNCDQATTLTVQYSQDNDSWFNTNNVITTTAGSDFNLDFWSAATYFRVINSFDGANLDLFYGCRS